MVEKHPRGFIVQPRIAIFARERSGHPLPGNCGAALKREAIKNKTRSPRQPGPLIVASLRIARPNPQRQGDARRVRNWKRQREK